MKRSSILLGVQRKPKKVIEKASSAVDTVDEDEWDIQYDLKKADEIVIVDDANAYQLFGDVLFSAPQEDVLEGHLSYTW